MATIKVGNYTGDGSSSLAITGVGFQPQFLWVKANANLDTMIKTSAHTGQVTSLTHALADVATGCVLSLDSDGFTVGNDARVNTNATVYQYIALADSNTSRFEVGTYTGNAADDRNISLSGSFTPNFVLVIPSNAVARRWKSAALVGDVAAGLDNEANAADTIQAFGAGNFQVGTVLNASGVVYYYLATAYTTANFETGGYTGDGSSDLPITFATGTFSPMWVIAKRTGSSGGMFTTSNIAAGSSYFLGGGVVSSTGIIALNAGGFHLGNGAGVNVAAVAANYVAFADAPAGSAIDTPITPPTTVSIVP